MLIVIPCCDRGQSSQSRCYQCTATSTDHASLRYKGTAGQQVNETCVHDGTCVLARKPFCCCIAEKCDLFDTAFEILTVATISIKPTFIFALQPSVVEIIPLQVLCDKSNCLSELFVSLCILEANVNISCKILCRNNAFLLLHTVLQVYC